MLHPTALAAVAALLVNDHLLKARWGNVLTGKLSDLAGLVLFPLLLVALLELRPGGRPVGRRIASAAALLTGIAFVAVQVLPVAGSAYELAWGGLRWPLDATAALVGGSPIPMPRRVQLWPDPTDLLTLPALAIAWWVAGTSTPGAPRPVRASRSQAEAT